MSSHTVSPAYSAAQPPLLQTPSPFAFSVASTRWSSRPPIQTADLCLRLLSLVLSFASALSLVALSPTNLKKHSELLYLFTANILIVVYACYQLFKIICDMAHRGIFISDKMSDYITFILDQFAGYLLISASSVAVPVIHNGNSFQKATVVSVCMSFASFLVTAATAILSGYKLCKRIMW
ncbi:hypothetical protein ACS0TY_021621 [Phlomoides rotata]